MSASSVLRRATVADLHTITEMIEEFYAIDHHPYRHHQVAAALSPLLVDDSLGQVWVFTDSAAEPEGYAVVTWGYSLESGGRDALLDEFYVRRRRQGIGGRAIQAIMAAAASAGASRLFLETEALNEDARRFYRSHGFREEESVWMSSILDPMASAEG